MWFSLVLLLLSGAAKSAAAESYVCVAAALLLLPGAFMVGVCVKASACSTGPCSTRQRPQLTPTPTRSQREWLTGRTRSHRRRHFCNARGGVIAHPRPTVAVRP